MYPDEHTMNYFWWVGPKYYQNSLICLLPAKADLVDRTSEPLLTNDDNLVVICHILCSWSI